MDPADRRPVHVAIDALAFGARPAGVGRYVTTLLAGLRDLPRPPAVTVLGRHGGRPHLRALATTVDGPGWLMSHPPLRLLWEQLRLPTLAAAQGADLIHGLMGVVPLRSRLPRVVTIHDVTFLTHPELHQPHKVAYFRGLLPRVAAAADAVITDSDASRAAILRLLPVRPDAVHVIPLAVDPRFRPAAISAVDEVRRRHRLDAPFILYAGVLEPRKNLARLIEATMICRQRGLPHRLILVGKWGWNRRPIELAMAAAGDAVQHLGFVTDDDLCALLSAADAFAYVPVAEGFGLPVAEALACGAAVVTSDCSSLPEVAGQAAELVDPLDVAAIAAGLERLLRAESRRLERRRAGPARAALLTPDRLAVATRTVYEQVLGRR